MKYEPTHLDLFSGIGGFAIASQAAGFRTVAFVERESFCKTRLAEIHPTVAIYSDIANFSGRPFRGVSLLTGGFPCQPFSQAGDMRGAADDRYLWPEMRRVIQEAEPDWIVGENVAGLDGLGLDDCISDLEAIGYEVAPPFEIPACAVNAPHERNRIWIVANLSRNGFETRAQRKDSGPSLQFGSVGSIEAAPHFDSVRELQSEGCELNKWRWTCDSNFAERSWVEAATEFCGVVHGIPNRRDRIKALGNAIVPQVAFQILKAIMMTIPNPHENYNSHFHQTS